MTTWTARPRRIPVVPPRAEAAVPELDGHTVDGSLAAHSSLAIAGRVRIGDDGEAMPVIRLLREASALAATVRWEVEIAAPVPIWALAHLPPPWRADGLDREDLLAWRRRFRYGMCYYRRGPGFLSVYDGRRDPVSRRTLTDPAAVEALERLLLPCRSSALSPSLWAVLPDLDRLGLVLRLGDHVMTLPWRPERWPVPCSL